MNVLIGYHFYLVVGLFLSIALNIFIAYTTKDNFEKTILWNRIGYFVFWALWAMVVFSGLIVFVFMKEKLNLPIIAMIVASVILPILDGYRAIKVGKLWREGDFGFSFAIKILLIEIAVVAIVTVLTLVK